MKRMYWRPRAVSRTVLSLISAGALAGFVLVETIKTEVRQPHFADKLRAAKVAEEAFKALRDARIRLRVPI